MGPFLCLSLDPMHVHVTRLHCRVGCGASGTLHNVAVSPYYAIQTGEVVLAFIPVPNCAAITMSYSIQDTDIAENTFAVQNQVSWTNTTLGAAGALFNTWNDTAVSGAAPYQNRTTATTLVQTQARDLTTQTSGVVITPYTGAHGAGTDASGNMAAGITKSFTARSGLSGRSQRGRIFVIGIGLGEIVSGDPNLLSPAFLDEYVRQLDALITDVSAHDPNWSLVVISRRHNNAPRATGVTTPITSWGYANQYVDYQRRRAPGHARHH